MDITQLRRAVVEIDANFRELAPYQNDTLALIDLYAEKFGQAIRAPTADLLCFWVYEWGDRRELIFPQECESFLGTLLTSACSALHRASPPPAPASSSPPSSQGESAWPT